MTRFSSMVRNIVLIKVETKHSEPIAVALPLEVLIPIEVLYQ